MPKTIKETMKMMANNAHRALYNCIKIHTIPWRSVTTKVAWQIASNGNECYRIGFIVMVYFVAVLKIIFLFFLIFSLHIASVCVWWMKMKNHSSFKPTLMSTTTKRQMSVKLECEALEQFIFNSLSRHLNNDCFIICLF